MASSKVAKGRRGEQEIQALIQEVADAAYRERGLPAPEISRGKHGRDLIGLPWLAPEVKRHEAAGAASIDDWWDQARRQARGGQVPVLIWRQNRRPWHVVLPVAVTIPGTAQRVVTRGDITLDAFRAWLHLAILYSLDTPVDHL